MKTLAYADPPYLGQGKLYPDHPESGVWDTLDSYEGLLEELQTFDGWALSLSSTTLWHILPLCPKSVRVMAWVKPFASFKKNVNPSYAWEPVIVSPARIRSNDRAYVRDWVAENITLKKGMVGAKPRRFAFWLFDILGTEPGDILVDLFPGSGNIKAAWIEYMADWPRWAGEVNKFSVRWESRDPDKPRSH